MVLGYSRALYVEFTTCCDLASFIRAHVNAFQYFGGVTATVLYDNLKSVVLFREGGNVQWNPQFLAFSRTYGFKPVLCTPGHAEGKGKVERPSRYIRHDFFVGSEFSDREDLNQKTRRWRPSPSNVWRRRGFFPCRRASTVGHQRGAAGFQGLPGELWRQPL